MDFLLIFVAAATHDLGCNLRLWVGGRLIGEVFGVTPYSFQILLRVWLPIALLTGLVIKLGAAYDKSLSRPLKPTAEKTN